MNTSTNEHEMGELFNNAISALTSLRDKSLSTLVGYSRTAQELEELKTRFGDLSNRMDGVVQEAQRVRSDLSTALMERDRFKKEAEENAGLADSYAKDLGELRQVNEEARSNVTRLGEELAEANRKLEEANKSVVRLGQDLEWSRKDRVNLREELINTHQLNDELEQKLSTATGRLSKLQGVMRELFPETTKVEPQRSYAETYGGERPTASDAALVNQPERSTDKPTNETEAGPVNEGTEPAKPWWDRDVVKVEEPKKDDIPF